MANKDCKRVKKNYYRIGIYFSSDKLEEVSIFFFLANISKKRKCASFLTSLLRDYLSLCGYDKPESLSLEDIEKLPKLNDLIRNKVSEKDSVSELSNALIQAISTINKNQPPVDIKASTFESKNQTTAVNNTSSENINIKKDNNIVKKKEDEESIGNNKEEDFDDNNSLSTNWLSGLNAFSK